MNSMVRIPAVFLLAIGGVVLSLFLAGCLGDTTGSGISTTPSAVGGLSIKKLKISPKVKAKRGHRPGRSLHAAVDLAGLGVDTIRATLTNLLTLQETTASAKYSPGGTLVVTNVPVGPTQAEVEGVTGNQVVVHASFQVTVEEEHPQMVDSLTLFSPVAEDGQGEMDIFDFGVTEVGATSAKLHWTTSRPALSFVEIGKEGSFTQKVDSSTLPVTEHEATINGLEKVFFYQARVTAIAENGLTRVQSAIITFSLDQPFGQGFILELADGGTGTAQREIELHIGGIGADGMKIALLGNEAEATLLPFATSMNFTLPNLRGDHTLVALFYNGLRQVGSAQLEVTYDDRLMEIVSFSINQITDTSVHISWITTKPAEESYIEYGLTTEYVADQFGDLTSSDDPNANSFAYATNLTGLNPGTLYHFRVVAVDNLDIEDFTEDNTVTTNGARVVFTFNPTFVTTYGIPQNSIQGEFANIGGIGNDSQGSEKIAVPDKERGVIQLFDINGDYLSHFGSGTLNTPLVAAFGVAGANSDPVIFVGDSTDDVVYLFNPDGTLYPTPSFPIPAPAEPRSIQQHPDNGNIHILLQGTNPDRINVIDEQNLTLIANQGLSAPDNTYYWAGMDFVGTGGVASFSIGYEIAADLDFYQASGTASYSVLAFSGIPVSAMSFNPEHSPPAVYTFSSNGLQKYLPSTNSTQNLSVLNYPYSAPASPLVLTYKGNGNGPMEVVLGQNDSGATGTLHILQDGGGANLQFHKTIGFPPGKNPIKVLPGKPYYNPGNEELLVPDNDSDQNIKVFDKASTEVKRVLAIGEPPVDITGDGTYYYALSSGDRVYRYSYGATQPNLVSAAFAPAGSLGIAATPDGVILIAKPSNSTIFRVNASTLGYLSCFGAFGSGSGQFANPEGVTVFQPTAEVNTEYLIFVADTGNDRIAVFDQGGQFKFNFEVPNENGLPPLTTPIDVDHLAGHILVTDTNNHIFIFSPAGGYQGMFGETGPNPENFQSIRGLAGDFENGGLFFVADYGRQKLSKFHY